MTSAAPPPPTYEELRKVLSAARDSNAVLVGGQALSFWCVRFLDVAHDDLGIITSRDIDLLGDREAAAICADRLGGTVRYAGDLDPVTAGVVTYPIAPGKSRALDILRSILGISRDAVFDAAIEAEIDDIAIRVMHPLHCLLSRFINIKNLPHKRDEHGLSQARASILCLIAYCHELVDAGQTEEVLWVYEKLFRFARTDGLPVYREHEISAFDSVEPLSGLPNMFIERRYPQMRAQIRDRESVARRALLEANARKRETKSAVSSH